MRISLSHRATDTLWEAAFSTLPVREIGRLVQLSTQVSRPAGTSLLSQGDRAGEVFVLLDGSVDVFRDGAVVASVMSGDVVGEMAAGITPKLAGQRNATVVASSDVVFAVFSNREWWAALEQCPQFAEHVTSLSQGRTAQ